MKSNTLFSIAAQLESIYTRTVFLPRHGLYTGAAKFHISDDDLGDIIIKSNSANGTFFTDEYKSTARVIDLNTSSGREFAVDYIHIPDELFVTERKWSNVIFYISASAMFICGRTALSAMKYSTHYEHSQLPVIYSPVANAKATIITVRKYPSYVIEHICQSLTQENQSLANELKKLK